MNNELVATASVMPLYGIGSLLSASWGARISSAKAAKGQEQTSKIKNFKPEKILPLTNQTIFSILRT